MERIELDLKDMMAAQAETARDLPPLGRTVGRARRRRVANMALAGSLAVAAVVGGATGVRVITRDESPPDVAAPSEGSFEFTSTPGAGDVVATGEFRDLRWELTAEATHGEFPELDIQMGVFRGGVRTTDRVQALPTDAAVVAQGLLHREFLGDAQVVYGALRADVESVGVAVSATDDPTITPHRFAGAGGELDVDYFVAFVPEEWGGFVHAYDEAGIIVGTSSYGGVQMSPSQVAAGKSGDVPWGVEFIGDADDRACITFYADYEQGRECVTAGDIDDADPMLLLTFQRPRVAGFVAFISDDVGFVRLVTDDGFTHDLPWFSPPDHERADWPLRLVAVGLESGTSGTLRVFDGGGNVIDEQRFLGRQAD
jgi:hypothetical protein